MSLLRRLLRPRTHSAPNRGAAAETAAPGCSCVEHVDDLLTLPLPVGQDGADLDAEGATDDPDLTVGLLVDAGALDVTEEEPYRLGTEGPFTFNLWVGDEARIHYDDDAPLTLEDALAGQPGVKACAQEDREVFHLHAPGMCPAGILAAAARALADDRVRQST